MPTSRRTELTRVLGELREEAAACVENLERSLAHAQGHAEHLAAAAETGDVTALVADPRTSDSTMMRLAPYLPVDLIDALLSRAWSDTHELVSRSIDHAAATDPPRARTLIQVVLESRTWPGELRVRTLATTLTSPQAEQLVTQAARSNAAFAVLCGMHLTGPGARAPWARSKRCGMLRASARNGPCRDRYLLGQAFRGGVNDPSLEYELVEFLSTIEPADVAARVAASLPPLVNGAAAAAARRLADLEAVVDAVDRPPNP